MRERPADVDERVVADAIAVQWARRVDTLEHRPVGFGSHHWRAGDLFVTVDEVDSDEQLDLLSDALATAVALHDEAGLGFVVAPLLTADGRAVVRLSDRHALAVYPHLDVLPGPSTFVFSTERHRPRARAMVDAVHTANVSRLARDDDLVLEWRADLELALADGTLAEHDGAVRRALDRYDELVPAARHARAPDWVITHGEPHPGNAIETSTGWRLVDWDTARVAPRERDLWMLHPAPDDVDADLVELYRMRWDLTDVASAVAALRVPHEPNADTETFAAGLEAALLRLG